MNNLQYFMISLVGLFILSFISIGLVGIFKDTSVTNSNSVLGKSGIYNLFIFEVNSNFLHYFGGFTVSIFGFNIGIPFINLFALTGDVGKNYISMSLNSLTYLPDFITIPFLILFIVSFGIFIIKLFLP